MSRISQEFYCGECTGYFLVRLNDSLNHGVEIVCPNCGHEHRRCIVDGQIFENGRHETPVKEKIRPTKVSYSKEPLTTQMKQAGGWGQRRDGSILTEMMRSRWLEKGTEEKGMKHEHVE